MEKPKKERVKWQKMSFKLEFCIVLCLSVIAVIQIHIINTSRTVMGAVEQLPYAIVFVCFLMYIIKWMYNDIVEEHNKVRLQDMNVEQLNNAVQEHKTKRKSRGGA